MARSTTTDPTSDGLSPDLVRYAQEYTRTVTAAPPAAPGVGRTLGLAGRGAIEGAGNLLQMLLGAAGGDPAGMALDMAIPGSGLQQIGQGVRGLADKADLPVPQTATERIGTQGVAGAVGGAPFGPVGIASGAFGGMGSQGAAELGGGPLMQLLAGLVAGAGPGIATSLRANRGPMGAARVIEETATHDDKSVAQALQSQPSTPGALGLDRMGRTGRVLAQRVAGEGGNPADDLVAAVTAQGEGAGDRVLQQVAQEFRVRPRDPNAALRVIRREMQTADRANYTDQMLNRAIPVDDELAFLLDDPVIRRAYASRQDVAQTRVSGPAGAPSNQPLPPLEELTPTGTRIASELPLRALNEIKKGLDDLARPAADGSKQITAAQAQAANTRLERIRARLVDPASPTHQPDYAKALETHADYEQRAALVKQGMQAFGGTIRLGPGQKVAATPEEIRRIVATAGPRAAYFRLGALERLRQKGATLMPEDIARVEAMLPPGKTVSEVVGAVGREAERSSTQAAVQGAGRGLRSGADMNIERAGADVVAQRYRPALRDAVLAFVRRGQSTRLPQPIRARLSRVLAMKDGPGFAAEAESLLADLETLSLIGPRATAASVAGAAGTADATARRRE